MREIKRIPVASISPDPEQPRKHFDEGELLDLGQNLKSLGQQLPVIVFANGDGFTLLDGERRWRAAQLVGIAELLAIALKERPSATLLHVIRMSLEAHKVGWSAGERSDCLEQIRGENDWTVGELATNLSMKQPLVSKLLAFQKLDPEVRKLLDAGKLDMEKAYVISQEADPARQRELAKVAGLSRDDLRRHVRNGEVGKVEPKASRVSLTLPGGAVVTVQRRELTLSAVVGVLVAALKECRRGLGQGLDVSTLGRVLSDRAKARQP